MWSGIPHGSRAAVSHLALKLSYIGDCSFLLHLPDTKQLASIRSTGDGQPSASQFQKNEKTCEGLDRIVLASVCSSYISSDRALPRQKRKIQINFRAVSSQFSSQFDAPAHSLRDEAAV